MDSDGPFIHDRQLSFFDPPGESGWWTVRAISSRFFDLPLVLPRDDPHRKYGARKRGGCVPKYEVTDAIRQMGEVLDRIGGI